MEVMMMIVKARKKRVMRMRMTRKRICMQPSIFSVEDVRRL